MLQNIRDKMQGHKWFTYTVLGALILVFAAWGAYGIVNQGFSTGDYAAKVNGEKISIAHVNELWQQQQPRLIRAAGGPLTDAQREQYQQELLDEEIRSLAITQYANKVGIRVSPEHLAEAFRREPTFQVDGKFNMSEARSRLAQAGMTEDAYVRDLKRTLVINQLLGSIGVSDFFTPLEMKRVLSLLDEEREVRYVLLQPESFAGNGAIDPAAIEAWYKEHSKDYMQPESAQLAYAELSLADALASVQISDKQLQERYERDKATYSTPETRHARHILIAVDGETDDAKAAATAKDVYAKLKAGGDFAALAKQFSKDPGSAAKGGELDWSGREVFVKEFADKLFAMKQGEISEPVKTQFGYHVIRLDGVRAATGRNFEQAKADVAAGLRKELAGTLFAEQQDKLQERVERGGYTLDQLVKEFNLHKGEVARFERGAGGLPLGSDAQLNQAVFSESSLQGRVGGPVQLGEDRVTVFQVLKHTPSQLKPLDEVRAAIVATLRREAGAKAALAAAEAAVGKLGSGTSFDKVAAELHGKATPAKFVSRGTADLPVEIRDAVFAAVRPSSGKPYRQAVKVEGGVALIEVTASRVQSMSDDPQLKQLRSERELQKYARRNANSYVSEIVKAARVSKSAQPFQ